MHCPSDNVNNGDRAVGAELLSIANDPRIPPPVAMASTCWLGGIPGESSTPDTITTTTPYPSQTAMIADCVLTVFSCVVDRRKDGTRVSSVAYANAIRPARPGEHL